MKGRLIFGSLEAIVGGIALAFNANDIINKTYENPLVNYFNCALATFLLACGAYNIYTARGE